MAFFWYSHRILSLITAVQLLLPTNTNAFSSLRNLSSFHSRSRASEFSQQLDLSVAFAIPPGRVEDIDEWIKWSSDSLKKATGESLICRMDGVDTVADVHANERYAVLSHGTQDDPVYNYFNRAAFQAFQFPDEQVYQLPSRYSAPPEHRIERARTIDSTKGDDCVVIPSAVRQTNFGDKFVMKGVLFWNVYDDESNIVGQTAMFDRNVVIPLGSKEEEGSSTTSRGGQEIELATAKTTRP